MLIAATLKADKTADTLGEGEGEEGLSKGAGALYRQKVNARVIKGSSLELEPA